MVFWRQVRYPKVFDKVTHYFGVLGFAIFDVGSLKCLFGWSYFDKLLFITLAPFGCIAIIALGINLYCFLYRDDKAKLSCKVLATYWILFFIYVVLPSISSFVITYFSCVRFDRGNRRKYDLEVLAVELSVKCNSTRYKKWIPYAASMIAMSCVEVGT